MDNVKKVIRGDSYGTLRPLFILKFASPTGGRYNLAGATVRTTYKPESTDPNVDVDDSGAVIRHEIVINEDGVVAASTGLALIGAASDGVIHEYLTSTESKALPLDVELYSDVQITIGSDTISFVQGTPVVAVDGYTNRDPSPDETSNTVNVASLLRSQHVTVGEGLE